MSKIIKEPLLHFVALGMLIYFSLMMVGDDSVENQRIIVTEGKIKHLATLYQKTWQRKPTAEQLEQTVQEYVLEQAAYYEGVNLGLDQNDIVIMRRVRQKLDIIAEENTPRPEVTDEILSDYLLNNGEKFSESPRLTIRQVYLDPKNYGNALESEIEGLLTGLTEQPDKNIKELGARYLFKPFYQRQGLTELSRLFGSDFVKESAELAVGQWHGPIHSSFGVHLVYVEEKLPGVIPELSPIRSLVMREWENSLRKKSTKKYYDELRARYPTTIHWPDDNKLVAR